MRQMSVLVVEDSLVFRELLVTNLNKDPAITVVAAVSDPFKARDAIIELRPDVMTLDIELLRMSGIEFLRKILTGMGGDGAKGLLAMRKAGAVTVGQDESTCVVYGMPKVAYDIGAVMYQEKLSDIPGRVYSLLF